MALLIAELCQNHNGDEKIVEEMVHAAAEAGADYKNTNLLIHTILHIVKDLKMV